jgi:hypothetical protein
MSLFDFSPIRRADYTRDGYFAISDFFNAREVAAMVAELERFKRNAGTIRQDAGLYWGNLSLCCRKS